MNKILKTILSISMLTSINMVYAATPVEPPNVPLESGSASSTKPNLMFIMDDSGSMLWDYLGDELSRTNCKSSALNYAAIGCWAEVSTGTIPWSGSAPSNYIGFNASGTQTYLPAALFHVYQFNKIYYNPNITYPAAVNSNGVSLGDKTMTTATINTYTGTTRTVDLNNLKELYYCTKTSPSASELNNASVCRRNGVNTSNPFNYYSEGYPNATYKNPVVSTWTPHYYNIVPTEYCDSSFKNCSLSASYGVPAPVRYCKTTADAASTALITGSNKCQKNFDSSSGYIYPRFGKLQRVTIPAAQYTNFANWFTYYRTRHDAMRSSVGLAFKGLDDTKRVGFITINPGSPVSSSKFLAIDDFDQAQKDRFYNLLYSVPISGGTPLREALSRVGRYYAGKSDGISSGMISSANPDPMQFSCQQNYAILSTDGYWNGNAGRDLSNNTIGNLDNTNTGYATRNTGAYDGGLSGSSSTLSDVAMYYYQTDLRPTGTKGAGGVDVSEDNVPISPNDSNSKQHMVTYAISLGLNGLVEYSKDYQKGGSQDFENIKLGTSGACSWSTGVCNWPVPVNDTGTAIDDLWHATVNGRGKYYSAQNTKDIIEGLTDALNSLIAQTASSSSASTSSPNITQTENTLFYSTYRTVHWDGEVSAKTIDYITGDISTSDKWKAGVLLNTRVSDSADTRTIYTGRVSGASMNRINFDWTTLNTAEKAYFTNKCTSSSLSQCANLTTDQNNIINSGQSIVNYVRGQKGYEESRNETNPLYRDRKYVLGDIVDASPVYVGGSPYNWADDGYADFKLSVDTRKQMLYVGANDGMLHALNANTGKEEWAYIPRQVLPKLYNLTDKNYSLNHKFYVNGSISVMDAKVGGTWKSILVGAMGQGSKGYYALDITNPNNPQTLWEFCTDSAFCNVTDSDIGWTYGQPIITKRASDSKWVAYVTSGYDNATGKGTVFELDLATGTVLRKLITNSGTATSPSGLANINTLYDNFYNDNKARVIYAGDLNGDVWRWELHPSANLTAQPVGFAAYGTSAVRQPITAKIELGLIEEKPVMFIATGQYLNFADYNTTGVQSIYAIKDQYAYCLNPPYSTSSTAWIATCKGASATYGNFSKNSLITKQNSNTSSGKVLANGSNVVDWNTNIGWYFDFNSQSGERVNIDPTLVLGTLNIVTNVPAANTCNMGGNAWIYQFNYLNGNAIMGQSGEIGFKYSGGFVVGQVVARLDGSGTIKNFITDAAGNIQSIGVNINSNNLDSNKSSWNEIMK